MGKGGKGKRKRDELAAFSKFEDWNISLRIKVQSEELKDKLESNDKDFILATLTQGLEWGSWNMWCASDEEFDAKQKEPEGIINPIMMKVRSHFPSGFVLPLSLALW